MISTTLSSRRRHLTSTDAVQAITFASPWGWMALAWRESSVARLSFGHADPQAARASLSSEINLEWKDKPPAWVEALRRRLERFALDEADDFQDIALDLSHLTPFQREVIERCREINMGDTLSYAGLATKAGSPNAARAVGNTMRSNRHPLIVPCHRVIGSTGKLCGFTSPQGISLKQRLLDQERRWRS